jgi:hypothetical protein
MNCDDRSRYAEGVTVRSPLPPPRRLARALCEEEDEELVTEGRCCRREREERGLGFIG